MFNMEEFLVAEGYSKLLPMIHVLIDKHKDPEFKYSVAKACSYFVQPFEIPYGDRLIEFCENLNN